MGDDTLYVNPLTALFTDTLPGPDSPSGDDEGTLPSISPTLQRRFVFEKLLGYGAGGAVYLCRDLEEDGKQKALKILASEHCYNDVSLTRFYNEGKAAWRISSEHVVKCLDIVLADGTFAYTMEYVDGENLARYLAATKETPTDQAREMLLQLAKGIATIHEHGIVHRDLKPSNIMISREGRVRITDLGVARIPDRDEIIEQAEKCTTLESLKDCGAQNSRLTSKGGVLGTLDYLSPEYVKLGQLDAKCDIYAFGLIGYQLLTRTFPFEGANPYMRILERITREPELVGKVNPKACPLLAEIIDRALSREPEHRPAASSIIDRLQTERRAA